MFFCLNMVYWIPLIVRLATDSQSPLSLPDPKVLFCPISHFFTVMTFTRRKFFLSLLTISFFTIHTNGQQKYSGLSALECDTNDKAGPSPAFLYTGNGTCRSCRAFLIFRSQSSYYSVNAISTLMSANQEELAGINNISSLSVFPVNKEVIIPVNCSVGGQYYQANTTFTVSSTEGTYYDIATTTFEGLSTCAALMSANPYDQFALMPGIELLVPLRCACPTFDQVTKGTNYLLTYPLTEEDDITGLAERFNVSAESILEANTLVENPDIHPDTTILIPLPTRPTSSQTIIYPITPSISPPPAANPEPERSRRKFYKRVAVAAACSLLLASIILATVLLLYFKRKCKVQMTSVARKWILPHDLRVEIASFENVLKVFGNEEVNKATNYFSGSHRIKGSVYRGEFEGEEILAVKRICRNVSEEVKILKRINHFNLIGLHGLCESNGCFYLIFEYMANGSLREWLSTKVCRDIESWIKRIEIAMDVANGLHYLHSFTEPAYVHTDIKSSNVLLNSNLRAKIANFSLARASARGTTSQSQTKHIVGTRGYMAPEYIGAGQVTPKIDVYAFGVVLLELIAGKDAVFMNDGKEALLSKSIVSAMDNENAAAELESFVDPRLKGSVGTQYALRLAKVSVACLNEEPASRPSMEEVVSTLLKIQADILKSESLAVDSCDTISSSCLSTEEISWRAETIAL